MSSHPASAPIPLSARKVGPPRDDDRVRGSLNPGDGGVGGRVGSVRTVYLNKPWYRARELPQITGIPRTFWRPHKKRGGVWIWRKTGTHQTAPVFLHVESVADELDRRRIPYHVNIGGREVDPGMVGYRHGPPLIRRPKGKYARAASRAAVWNPAERARTFLEARLVSSDADLPGAHRAVEYELCLFRLEAEYLRLRMEKIGTAIRILECGLGAIRAKAARP